METVVVEEQINEVLPGSGDQTILATDEQEPAHFESKGQFHEFQFLGILQEVANQFGIGRGERALEIVKGSSLPIV